MENKLFLDAEPGQNSRPSHEAMPQQEVTVHERPSLLMSLASDVRLSLS
jgi:hypothetical protein